MFLGQFSSNELQILQERARRIAKQASDTEADEQFSALRIRVRTEHYAVYLDELMAIYRDVDIVPVPCTPAHLKGIANVRGRIMPVIDLGTALSIPTTTTKQQGQLIVAERAEDLVALFVEQVEDVTSYRKSSIQPVPADIHNGRTIYTSGILPDGTLILDIHTLLNDNSLVINS